MRLVKPKKALGQHFLKDLDIARRIAAQPQELRDHQAIFIRRVVRLRGDAVCAGDMPVIEKADHHIGVADVDCDQKHVEFSLRLLY